MTIEYRVKRVERFIVNRYEDDPSKTTASVRQIGKEFDSFDTAYEVATALARAEQERLGIPPGGDGVIFPSQSLEDARAAAGFDRPLETYHSRNDQIGGE
ncbi:hypothetical protein [Agrobacterium pusense]|uniref:hypothetical protein n=1 Tax=Agrobacterium pusense TaxID=648995 RepID=UPI000D1A9BC2|nr:hypothetical protein [Agrobacterium pusense]